MTDWRKLKGDWKKVERKFGGVHPHRAADVIIAAVDEAKKAGSKPRYLHDLQQTLNNAWPSPTGDK